MITHPGLLCRVGVLRVGGRKIATMLTWGLLKASHPFVEAFASFVQKSSPIAWVSLFSKDAIEEVMFTLHVDSVVFTQSRPDFPSYCCDCSCIENCNTLTFSLKSWR